MMANDERLTPAEVELAVKCLLAKKLKSSRKTNHIAWAHEKKPMLRPSPLMMRTVSPDTSSSALSPLSLESSTPVLSSSSETLVSPQRSRAATMIGHRNDTRPGRTLCNGYSDSHYEYELIESAFARLYDRLKDTDGVRYSPEQAPEIHIWNFEQYLLECYISTQISLSAMLAPLKAAKWVDLKGFTAALEALQTVSYEHSFFNKDELRSTRDNLMNQKLHCEG